MEAKKDSSLRAGSSTDETSDQDPERPELAIWQDLESQYVTELSLNVVRAINNEIGNTEEILRIFAHDFEGSLGFPTFPTHMNLNEFVQSIERLRRQYPYWRYRYQHSSVRFRQNTRAASVFAVLKQDGVPRGQSQEVVMRMEYQPIHMDQWVLHSLQTICSMDFDTTSSIFPASINREGLEALSGSSEVKRKAPASTVSSSCLTSQGSLISHVSSLNQSVSTQATSIFERYFERKPESPHSTPSEAGRNSNESRESSPSAEVGGLQGFAASGSPTPAANPSRLCGQPSDWGENSSASFCGSDHSRTDHDESFSYGVSQKAHIVRTAPRSYERSPYPSSVRSGVLKLARRSSLPLASPTCSSITKPFTHNVRATSCPTTDRSGGQTLCDSGHSTSSDSDDSTECTSDWTASISCDGVEYHDRFVGATLFQPHSQVHTELQQSCRLFQTWPARASTSVSESHTPFDRLSRSTSLSISNHDHFGHESSRRATTEPPSLSKLSKQCYNNVEGTEVASSESHGVSSPRENEAPSVAIGASTSSRSQKRRCPESEKDEEASGSPSDGKKRQGRREGSIVKDRFPCIFHVGEPDRHPGHIKKYKHISLLV